MPDASKLIAVILAGGLGTRLRSSVADRPKSMALVNERPFLTYLLEHLHYSGLRKAILCTGYMGDYIEENLGSSYRGLNLTYSREHKPLGTAGALKLAEPVLVGKEILVMNGDTFVQFNAQEFLVWHKKKNAKISMLLSKGSNPNRYGCVDVDEYGQIISFSEKGQLLGNGLISAGVYILSREVIDDIPNDTPCSLEVDVFTDNKLYGYKGADNFIDIGTPDSYSVAGVFLKTLFPRSTTSSLIIDEDSRE